MVTLAFSKGRFADASSVTWHHVGLGDLQGPGLEQHSGGLRRRIAQLCRSVGIVFRHRETLRNASAFYARNLDMALLAVLGQVFARSRAPLIYEVLDIRDMMLGRNVPSRLARVVERSVLRHASVLVVSSPAFVSNYFEPLQRYKGPTRLLENKLAEDLVAPVSRPEPPIRAPWVLEWTGSLRCERSLQILCDASDTLDGKLLVRLHGVPSRIGRVELERRIAPYRHVTYHGPYKSPDGLADAFDGAHLNWCVDLSNWPANSAWLLPNRLYEGGYFAVPAVGLGGTCTGDVVEARRMGFLLSAPTSSALVELIDAMDPEDYARVVRRLADAPRSEFVETTGVADLLDDVHERAGGRRR